MNGKEDYDDNSVQMTEEGAGEEARSFPARKASND